MPAPASSGLIGNWRTNCCNRRECRYPKSWGCGETCPGLANRKLSASSRNARIPPLNQILGENDGLGLLELSHRGTVPSRSAFAA